MRVWDPLVRLGHWLLVAGIATAWLTQEGARAWHERIGYGVLAVLGVRVLWGFVGSRHARFGQFVRPPAETVDYARAVLQHREPRHLGHNPLGGWMIVATLLVALGTALSGWLYTTDEYWGVEWVEDLHEALSDALMVLVALHVGGVVFTSLRHRENLVAAMLNGRKRGPAPGDVE